MSLAAVTGLVVLLVPWPAQPLEAQFSITVEGLPNSVQRVTGSSDVIYIAWTEGASREAKVVISPAVAQPDKTCWAQWEDAGNTILEIEPGCAGADQFLNVVMPTRISISPQGETAVRHYAVDLRFPGQSGTSSDRTSVFVAAHFNEEDIKPSYSLVKADIDGGEISGCRRDTDRPDDFSWRCDPKVWVGNLESDVSGPRLPAVQFVLRPDWFSVLQQVELIILAVATGILGSAVVALVSRRPR